MKPELEQQLLEKYPTLYKDLYGPMNQTCMHWGFDHGDGWYDLLDELSAKILEIDPTVVAEQVKEKFGALRYYYSNDNRDTDKKLRDLIWSYEEKSGTICEVCGEAGTLKSERGWLTTLCKKHRDERNQK